MNEVLIIGAGINGLVAAIYLAKAGRHVTVLEAGDVAGGICASRMSVGDYVVPKGPQAFQALDPRVLKDLKLAARLAFTERDLPLVLLHGGEDLTLPRDVHECARALATVSGKDGERYAAFRREHFAFARAMRPLWWEDGELRDEATRSHLRRLQVTSAQDFVEAVFESDLARVAFAFDALAVNPAAPGSALVLAWAASQEICGLQGAIAVPQGGPGALADMLVSAAMAAGVDIRFNTAVARLDLDGEAVRRAVLTSGETVEGRTILSALSRKRTLLELLPPGTAGFAAARKLAAPASVGEAKLVLSLSSCPSVFARAARYVIGEKLEGAALAYAEARDGRVPSDLFLEVIVQEADDRHGVLLSVRVRPVPVSPAEGWAKITPRVVQAVVRLLEHHAPGLAGTVTGFGFAPPEGCDPLCLADLAAPWKTRVQTPVRGLYLCGAAAEPVPCVSGRAGRIAAAMVIAEEDA